MTAPGGPRTGLLLAAGRSCRFGAADKLLAPLDGAPLVTHAAGSMRRCGLDRLIAVVRSAEVAALLAGFDPVFVAEDETAQSTSLRAGVLHADALGAAGVLVALGDMPRVPAAHMERVMHAGRTHGIAATARGEGTIPPAWFARDHFGALTEITGDQGARAVLRAVPPAGRISCSGALLVDIDRPEDLTPP